MARRKKPKGGDGGDPAWLITFSDLMTLLLTFFVLLLSMAVIDERAKREVLGSVSRAFASGARVFNPLTNSQENTAREPGVMQEKDMAPMRDMLFDDVEKDLNFQENKYVQIFSINDQVLFKQGSTILSEKGIELLDRILPYMQRMEYPLLVAGHTAARRDEENAEQYRVETKQEPDSTWALSFHRALAVYRHFIERGLNPAKLSLEAFGQYHPRYTNNTPEGRQKNRRVDLVLDKRNQEWAQKVEELREKDPPAAQMYYRGFKFDLTLPDTAPAQRLP